MTLSFVERWFSESLGSFTSADLPAGGPCTLSYGFRNANGFLGTPRGLQSNQEPGASAVFICLVADKILMKLM
jgi:hypothetical protein